MQVWFGWFLLLGSVYGAPEIWPPNGKLKPNNYIPPTTTPLPKIGKKCSLQQTFNTYGYDYLPLVICAMLSLVLHTTLPYLYYFI